MTILNDFAGYFDNIDFDFKNDGDGSCYTERIDSSEFTCEQCGWDGTEDVDEVYEFKCPMCGFLF